MSRILKAALPVLTSLLLTAAHADSRVPGYSKVNLGNIDATQQASQSPRAATSSTNADIGELGHDDFVNSRLYSKFVTVLSQAEPALRGLRDVQIYKKLSPAVVLIATNDGFGSGVVVSKAGDIITNWHVVSGYETVAVIFKPLIEGSQPKKGDIAKAEVVRVDETTDLALLRVSKLPAHVVPLPLGNTSSILVGADVHAIGHPTGEAWTYTKGVISQFRKGYKWSAEETQKAHKADVIQTQTPINPGNSGGPLISDDGMLIGINSFKSDGEGLNFAVSINDVRRILAATQDRHAANIQPAKESAASSRACQTRETYSGPSKDRLHEITVYDTNCDGKPDVEIRIPYKSAEPIVMVADKNGDGKIDAAIFDTDRDGKWDYSLYDVDADGQWDLIGYHDDGSVQASRFENFNFENYSAALARVR